MSEREEGSNEEETTEEKTEETEIEGKPSPREEFSETSTPKEEEEEEEREIQTPPLPPPPLPPTTKEQKQSRTNELGLHEQWRSIQRCERRKTREERKDRREITKERLVDRLDEKTEKLDRELDVAEKQTRAMAKAHLETAEMIYDAALKCKKQMRMDLEESMRKAFSAFAKEAEEVRKTHEERVAVAERAMKEMTTRFENQELNSNFPRHASTMAEIKNQAEEERANLRSTLGARLERARRDVYRASGCERERAAPRDDGGMRVTKNDDEERKDDNDDDSNTDLDENEGDELMTLLNTTATNSAYDAYHPKLLHHRFRRINRLKDAKLQRMEETLSKITREREKWQRKTASLEQEHSEDARKIETQTRAALRQARDARRLRAKKSKEQCEQLKQKLAREYYYSHPDIASPNFTSKSDDFRRFKELFKFAS